jgi:hypothetical protein
MPGERINPPTRLTEFEQRPSVIRDSNPPSASMNPDAQDRVRADENMSTMDDVSDGYHTFGELYDHRRALMVALMSCNREISWRSKQHHPDDQPMFDGYFVVGMDLPIGQISYHYKLSHWDDFSGISKYKHAPKYDGHTPQSTVDNLIYWAGMPKKLDKVRELATEHIEHADGCGLLAAQIVEVLNA